MGLFWFDAVRCPASSLNWLFVWQQVGRFYRCAAFYLFLAVQWRGCDTFRQSIYF